MAAVPSGKIHVYHFTTRATAPDDPGNLPGGVRYLATLQPKELPTWESFWIEEQDEAPASRVVGLGPPSPSGLMAAADETAIGIRPYFLKTSAYHDYSAFLRIQIGDRDPE